MSRLALFAAALLVASTLANAPARADTTASDPISPQVRTAYDSGCDWTDKRLSDPTWHAFLAPIAKACDVIREGGYLGETRTLTTTGPVAELAAEFALAIDRAARGLDALYLQLWRERLDKEAEVTGVVALNDTGVFLALQHEHVFRHADRLLWAHGLSSKHASLGQD